APIVEKEGDKAEGGAAESAPQAKAKGKGPPGPGGKGKKGPPPPGAAAAAAEEAPKDEAKEAAGEGT
ncbi:unnamed protein product, partial [Symbiodinium natans]